MTWEDAVKELRKNQESHQAILDNYFDENIDQAIERFSLSEEFNAVLGFVPKGTRIVLDIGAGRGMASYGFAKRGMKVVALEPDPSNDVGAGAIRAIATKHKLPITIVETVGEALPFENNTFDLIYVRQVLHHANDLPAFCREVNRVLKPGGIFIATREHVISRKEDLNLFLEKHPLHHLYGGEHAFTLEEYLSCITNSGLVVKELLHPYSSVINYAPMRETDMKVGFERKLSSFVGKGIAKRLMKTPSIARKIADIKARGDNSPGRLYSFVCIKPI